MSEPVRVGVIGTGYAGNLVAPAFAAAPPCEVVDMVTARDSDAVAALCARPDLDLVAVHSPPFMQLDHVRWATAAGHAVLCDKPFGRDASESAQMVALADRAGVLNFLNFERRFDPARERLRALLADGAIGTPSHFQYSRFMTTPDSRPWTWLNSRELGGGWIGGHGSHLIDAFRWLFGAVDAAHAVTRTDITTRAAADGILRDCDAEDRFTGVVRAVSGATAVIDCSIASAVDTPEVLAVYGSLGMLEIRNGDVIWRDGANVERVYPSEWQGKLPIVLSMERFAVAMCHALRTGELTADMPTFADGLACSLVMEQMGR